MAAGIWWSCLEVALRELGDVAKLSLCNPAGQCSVAPCASRVTYCLIAPSHSLMPDSALPCGPESGRRRHLWRSMNRRRVAGKYIQDAHSAMSARDWRRHDSLRWLPCGMVGRTAPVACSNVCCQSANENTPKHLILIYFSFAQRLSGSYAQNTLFESGCA